VKYAWIAEQGQAFALSEMCAVLDVSISGYRAWKRGGCPDRKRLSDCQMTALIRTIHAEFRGAYGSPRMVRELRARGFSASKERVERLMRDNGIHTGHPRRDQVTTDSTLADQKPREPHPVATLSCPHARGVGGGGG